MPTKNRRVATYLPPELDDRLKAFIEERGLKGDSPALITILSEFFGVGYKVAQAVDYSNFVTKAEFLELSEKVLSLEAAFTSSNPANSILGKLLEKLKKIESRIDCLEATTEDLEVAVATSTDSEDHPGQMSLLTCSEHSSESLSNSKAEPSQVKSDSYTKLQPLSGYALAKRIGRSRSTLSNNKDDWWEDSPEKFIEWIKEIDPDGIAWRYDSASKKYHPIINSSPVSFSSSPV